MTEEKKEPNESTCCNKQNAKQSECCREDVQTLQNETCCNKQNLEQEVNLKRAECCKDDRQHLRTVEEEIVDYKDKYIRLLAEMENSRKRLVKEKQDLHRFAIDNAFCEILLPLDQFESALGHADNMTDEVKNWAMGFQMILGQFKEALGNYGITAFSAKGKEFDPHLHEAVEMEETEDHPEGTIIEEFVRGYRSGERTLRAARVKVAKAPVNEPKEEEENNDEEI